MTEDKTEEKRIEIYRGAEGEVVFDVDATGETIWATYEQMADLFSVDRTVIVRHVNNIYKEGELSTCAKNAHVDGSARKKNFRVGGRTMKEVSVVRKEGNRMVQRKVKMYNLDMIISVGYRVNSKKATNLLYFIIKDHPFYDGNKRIGALLFVLFLTLNNYNLTERGETKISDRALTAIALLIAESEPSEKRLIVSLVCKLLE